MMSEEHLGLGGQEKLKNADPNPPMTDPLAERLRTVPLICPHGVDHIMPCDAPRPDYPALAAEFRAFLAERVTAEKIAARCYLSTVEAQRVLDLLRREVGG